MICVLRPVRVIGIYASLGRGDGRGDCAGGRLGRGDGRGDCAGGRRLARLYTAASSARIVNTTPILASILRRDALSI